MKNTLLRLVLTVLALVLVFSLAACKDENPDSLIGADTTPADTTPADTTVHEHEYASTVVAPTCYAPGYTLSVCLCGDSRSPSLPNSSLIHTASGR